MLSCWKDGMKHWYITLKFFLREKNNIAELVWLFRFLSFGCFSETEGISLRIQTCVKIPRGPDIVLKLLFHLPIGYPSRLPSVSVNSEQLTKAQCMVVKEKLLDEARRRLSQPMVHELILWIHQNLKRIVGNAEASTCCGKETLSTRRIDDAGVWTILLHFNHMRAKGKYIKTVGKWCTDLQLNGRLMFLGKVILMLLQGDRSSIKVHALLCGLFCYW